MKGPWAIGSWALPPIGVRVPIGGAAGHEEVGDGGPAATVPKWDWERVHERLAGHQHPDWYGGASRGPGGEAMGG